MLRPTFHGVLEGIIATAVVSFLGIVFTVLTGHDFLAAIIIGAILYLIASIGLLATVWAANGLTWVRARFLRTKLEVDTSKLEEVTNRLETVALNLSIMPPSASLIPSDGEDTPHASEYKWLVDLKDHQLTAPSEFVLIHGIQLQLRPGGDRKLSICIDVFNGSVFGLRVGTELEGFVRYDTEQIMGPRELADPDTKNDVIPPGTRHSFIILYALSTFSITVTSEGLRTKFTLGNLRIAAEFIGADNAVVKDFKLRTTNVPITVL